MNLGFAGRPLETMTVRQLRVVAARLLPYILFPNSPKPWTGFQVALSANRQLGLCDAEHSDSDAIAEEKQYFERLGGLKQLVQAESLSTYLQQYSEAKKDIATVGYVGLYFHRGRAVLGDDTSKNLVFKFLASEGRVEGEKHAEPDDFHHNTPSAIKQAWKDREVAAPIISALCQLGLEKRSRLPLPDPDKLIAKNFERFAALLAWYTDLLTTTESTRRKEAPITAEAVWCLPKNLTELGGKPIAAAEPLSSKHNDFPNKYADVG